MKRVLTIIGVIGIVALIIFLLARNKKTINSKNKAVDRSQVPVAVTMQRVRMQEMGGRFTVPATLSAKEEANISATASGHIVDLNIELGSVVGKGQVIGRLDLKENEIKLQSAELSIEKLNRDYERNKILVSGNATNANAVKDSKYDLDSKKLEAEQLKKQILDGNIVSPINGIITEKKMVAGEYANLGSVIAVAIDVSTLKARVYVAENNVFRLRTGQKAVITSEVYPGETFNGTITYISPKGDDNHNYLVELSVQNNKASRLRAGVYVLAGFETGGTHKVLQVPKTALADGMKNPYVYVVENGKAAERKIVLGNETGENVEVMSGLKEGEQIVTEGQINIINGSLIKQ